MVLQAVSSWSNYPILGPYSIAVTALTTVAQQVVAADTARKGIMFSNPGTKNKRILPVGQALAGGSGGILLYPQTEWQLLQTDESQFNVNCAWQAVTDDNTDGSLTALNFTPNTPGAPEAPLTTRLLQQNPISSPVGTPITNIGLVSVLVLAADANRMGVEFMNPGTNQIAVCPSNLAASIGAGSIIILPGASKRILGNDHVKVNCGWNAVCNAGGNNALTALGLYG